MRHWTVKEHAYCGLPVAFEDASNEHMVPLSLGGPNHIANFALTHKPCNQRAGNLAVTEKVKLANETRNPKP